MCDTHLQSAQRGITQSYLPPTRLSTSGRNHTCLYSPAAEHKRTAENRRLSWPGLWCTELSPANFNYNIDISCSIKYFLHTDLLKIGRDSGCGWEAADAVGSHLDGRQFNPSIFQCLILGRYCVSLLYGWYIRLYSSRRTDGRQTTTWNEVQEESVKETRSTGTVHTSAKARLTSIATRIVTKI